MITKGFIFEVLSQSLKRREAENYGDNNQSIHAGDAARWTLDHVTWLNYLAGKQSGKYCNKLPYELSFLSLLIYLCMAVSYPSLFSWTCLVVTDSKLIRNSIWIGHSKIRNIRNTIFAGTHEAGARNNLIKYRDSHHISVCLSPTVSLSLQSAL